MISKVMDVTETVKGLSLTKISNEDVKVNVNKALKSNNLWKAAIILGDYQNTSISNQEKDLVIDLITQIRTIQGQKACTATEPTTVVFGTSGWRGIIGEDFTVLNVAKVARSIIEMMKTKEFLDTNGYASFEDVQKRGIVVFRDNRYLGDEFMHTAMKELAAEGIKIYAAGECPTGVGSALVTELGAAGSFNFTPSHNPMHYAGLKFNPADGGPADKVLTDIIMEKSLSYMAEDANFEMANISYSAEKVEAAEMFKTFLEKSEIFDLAATRSWLKAVKDDIFIVVDNMHGSSRGYVEALLGEDVLNDLVTAEAIVFLNTNTDYSFHGVKPEPSATNMKPLIALAKEAKAAGRQFTFVCALDPDADRIRFGSADMDIDMNKFGPMAYASLLDRGLRGPIATSLPSSDFGIAIAKAQGQEVYETPVGFKEFRPYRDALICFEESDGISAMGHTLEKDAVAGFLLALDIMRTTGLTISDYYKSLQERYGYYYAGKAGVDVEGVSVDEWQAYKKSVVGVLQGDFYKKGDTLAIAGKEKTIARTDIGDGLKIIFEDNSWILLRPSGTEPKFRVYFEVTSDFELSETTANAVFGDYEIAGTAVLNAARKVVDQANN